MLDALDCVENVLQTYGVYLAACGKANVRDALKRVAQMPGMYAMVLGLAVNALGVAIPPVIFDPLKLVGDSIVPFLLVVLGMQLASVSVRGNLRVASVATVLRLGVAGLISIFVANVMGLQGVTRQTMILENSMPTAIFGVALAQEFDTAVDLITTVFFISTLASMFTLTIWLAVIRVRVVIARRVLCDEAIFQARQRSGDGQGNERFSCEARSLRRSNLSRGI